MRKIIFMACALVAVAALGAATAGAERRAEVSVVASGLEHPGGIAAAPDGGLYVTEMGHGGDTCYDEPDFIGFGPLGPACYGQSGAITRIKKNGQKDRVVDGLFSIGVVGGAFTVGPTGVAVMDDGQLLVTMMARSNCRTTDIYPWWARAQIGKLLLVRTDRHTRVAADVNGFECRENPDGAAATSYPIAVVTDRGRAFVADSGGDDILEWKGSKLRTFGVSLPGFAPTSLALGPDGALYAGVCNCVGEGKILRFVAGQAPTVFADGFGWVTGLAFGRDGSLYVVEETFDPNDGTVAHGDVVRIARNGTRTTIVPQGTLEWPSQAVWGPDQALYVINHAVFSPTGEVVRIKP